jgi:GNAT superfamily N-acetyltransferase
MKLFEIAFNFNDLKEHYSSDKDYNKVLLTNKSGQVGYIEWDKHSGEVNKIYVGAPYRRMGVATHLWELAVQWAKDNDELEPEHSSRRTKDGDEFANAIGGHIPDLTDDIDGWTSR